MSAKAKTTVERKAKSSGKSARTRRPSNGTKTTSSNTAKKVTKSAAKSNGAGSAAARKSVSEPGKTKQKRPVSHVSGEAGNAYSNRALWQPTRLVVKGDAALMKTLLAEHRHMASVMHLLSEQLDAIAAGERVDAHLVYEIMDYMVAWPDRFHHPREDLIYARVAELDAAGADEVDTLQRDHDATAALGVELLRDVASWRTGVLQGVDLVQRGRAYIAHIYEHMNVEECLVFPHIESVLSDQDWRELEAEDQLEAVATPIFGPKVQREFRAVARKLRRNLRRSVERQAVSELLGLEAFMESVDVVSMAFESSRHTTAMHVRDAVRQAGDIVLANPLTAPWRMALNNARVSVELVSDVAEISRETFEDIAKINRARRDWVRRLDQTSQRR